MPATILDHTVGATTERGANVSGAQLIRPWKDDSWTTIRIGIRYAGIGDPGTNIATPVFSTGLCSGSVNCAGDTTVAHGLYVGNFRNNVANYTNYIRTSGTNQVLFYDGGNTLYVSKYENQSASAPTHFASVVAQAPPIVVATTGAVLPWRAWWFEVTRDGGGAGIYTGRVPYRNATSFETTNVTQATFLAQMEAATPTFTGMGTNALTNMAIDEATYGVFDHVNLFWDKSSPTIHITDFVVLKIL